MTCILIWPGGEPPAIDDFWQALPRHYTAWNAYDMEPPRQVVQCT